MNSDLRENKVHGTPLYHFNIYKMHDENAKMFVSHHWHEEIEIIYVMNGSVYININNNKYIGEPGDIFFINKEELHEMYVEDTSTLYYAFLFPMEYLSFSMYDFVESSYIQPLYNKQALFINKLENTIEISKKMCKLLDFIIFVNDNKTTAYQFGTKTTLLQIIYLLIENNLIIRCADSKIKNITHKVTILKEIVSYIEEHHTNKISLNDISKTFNMAPKYFCKFFKANFNKTFVEYVNYVRIEKAISMLISTDMTIMDIAFSTGFENFSYFILRFKAITGCTPSKYRCENHNTQY